MFINYEILVEEAFNKTKDYFTNLMNMGSTTARTCPEFEQDGPVFTEEERARKAAEYQSEKEEELRRFSKKFTRFDEAYYKAMEEKEKEIDRKQK